MNQPNCPYCGSHAKLVTGEVIYPHRPDLYSLYFWKCNPCEAFVGTHKNSKHHAPLGRLANAELRNWKKRAHAVFDPLWKEGHMSRKEAYAKASAILNIPLKHTHIGMFDERQCQTLIDALTKETA